MTPDRQLESIARRFGMTVANADPQDRTAAQTRRVRSILIEIGWKIAVVLTADFILLRLWAPNLINMHQDLALIGALACFLAAVVVTGWLAFQLWIDFRKLADAKRQLARVTSLRIVEK